VPVVRLLSYNVRSLRDDTAALARVIRACAPDVVCVQEAPRFFRWRAHAARLGRATGLTYVTGGAPSCGTMIMASPRSAVERTEDVILPHTPGLHRRGLATAVLRFGGAAPLGVISCHLSLEQTERHQQSGLVLRQLAVLGAPVGVVAGDINERPGGRAFRLLAAELTDAWAVVPEGGEFTFPSHAPVRRIDAVLCTPGVEPIGCGVPGPASLPGTEPDDLRRATDHLPVLATLRLPTA
jgi:endonuclease/exonuclease/phosphatase family metal-dependent hydrolase